MKIVLINVTYGIGSTGIIVQNLKTEYEKNRHTVLCLYGRKTAAQCDKNVRKCSFELESKICHFFSKITGNLYGGMFFSTRKIIRMIKKFRPDAVHLHCLNGFFVNVYGLLRFLKNNSYKTILTNHAEFMFTANCGYSLECDKWKTEECKKCPRIKEFNGKISLNRTHHFYKKMYRAFNGFDSLVITNVSPWLANRCKESPIMIEHKIVTILNGIRTNDSDRSANPYIDELKYTNKSKVALFICNQLKNPEKGFEYFVKLANLMKDSNYLFILVGAKSKSIESGNIKTFDYTDSDSLNNYYYYADITLLFSKRETFSMIVAESLCNGTKVVGFCAGGPETIALKDYSQFVKYGDLESVMKILNSISVTDKEAIIRKAREKYSYSKIANSYIELMNV